MLALGGQKWKLRGFQHTCVSLVPELMGHIEVSTCEGMEALTHWSLQVQFL
jgi:hypothetical protein